MSGIIDSVLGSYNYVIHDLSDVRTKNLPLMSRPFLIISTVILYLKFCTDYGPRFMKNRKPFELKYPIMAYNIFQVIFSMFLVQEGLHYLLSKDYNFFCDPIVISEDPRLTRTAVNSWWYFFAKLTELLDTIFFVFRKKYRQVSTLHLYHHSIVVVCSWMAIKYYPGGPIVLVGTLNSFVHVLMYSYYFIAGLGPKYQKYLWWKRHVTEVQLIQFMIIIAHNIMALFYNCNYPKAVHVFLILNTSYIMALFGKFYFNTYIKTQPKKDEDVTTKLREINTRRARSEKRLSVGQ